jgi:HSP20 family protein
MTETETSPPIPPAPSDPQSPLDQWFDDLASRLSAATGVPISPDGSAESAFPRLARTDLLETPESFRIVAELPGITKEQLELEVEGTTVAIQARAPSIPLEGTQFLHKERRRASFQRYIELPEPVVAGQVKATLKEGLLTVVLPKEHPEPTPVTVRVPID